MDLIKKLLLLSISIFFYGDLLFFKGKLLIPLICVLSLKTVILKRNILERIYT